jgi:hypothetical protein
MNSPFQPYNITTLQIYSSAISLSLVLLTPRGVGGGGATQLREYEEKGKTAKCKT